MQKVRTGEMWDPEFRRSLWKGLFPMAFGLLVGAIAMMGDNTIMSVFGAITFLGGCWELFLAIRDPILTITPGIITHRSGRFGGAVEIPKPDVEFWKGEPGAVVIHIKGKKPVRIRLAVLRAKDRPRLTEMLSAFGYPMREV